jgi:hypothetical protein
MRKQILAGVAVLAFAAGVTTGAMASDHKAGRGSHLGRIHAGGMHGASARRGSEFASEGGWEGGNAYGGYRNLGPLGITFGCGRSSCGQGYSVSAWSW